MENNHHLPLPLPQDVLIQILVFLPVISLLRFKSVCKSWLDLIQSSFFIDLHVNAHKYYSYSSKFGSFILQTSQCDITRKTMQNQAFMLSAGAGGVDEFEELKLEDLGFPSRYKVSQGIREIFMVGSCNGLICIYDTNWRDISLWNPATRQFRLVPISLTLSGIGVLRDVFVAFGYDVKNKDYKVLQISTFRPYMSGKRWLPFEEYTFRVQVYNLSTDSWRLLEGIDSLPAFPVQAIGCNQGVYWNGSYYFLGTYYPTLLSFDFTKEIFTIIDFPPMQFPHQNYSMFLTYFSEKLALFATEMRDPTEIRNHSEVENYDIWVLNEHDVKESWTKLHPIGASFSGIPRGISNNGELVLIGNRRHRVIDGVCRFDGAYVLQLFDLVNSKQVKKDFLTGCMVIRADVYKQSLVSIGGNGKTADHRVNVGAM